MNAALSVSASKVPALLTMAQYAGTLATARYLAGHGVELVMGSDRLLAPAFWSRYIARRILAPSVARGPAALAQWLLEFGEKNPGTVLHPTSDDIAWVIARYAPELRRFFHLYVPSETTLRNLLDKRRLYEASAQAGVPVPKTWFPESADDVAKLWDDARMLLVKPRAQTFLRMGGKGELVTSRQHAIQTWNAYRNNTYAPGTLQDFPAIQLPMLQEYEPSATQGTYSLTGFVDSDGRILVARASTKVLQTSRTGIGMCFVASEIDESALQHVATLCKHVGFFGTFEVEFVRSDGAYKLIDFNPRYYGQMGFDIARGAPFPWMLQHAALGKTRELEKLASPVPPSGAPTLYRDRVALTWWLGTALASGAVKLHEAARWRRMNAELSQQGVDASWREDDPAPSLVAAAAVAWSSLRHPFAFLRALRKNAQPYQLPVSHLTSDNARV